MFALLTAVLFADDPGISRLAHALTALHWIAGVLAGCLVLVAALAVAIYRKNKRMALTRRDDDSL